MPCMSNIVADLSVQPQTDQFCYSVRDYIKTMLNKNN